MVVTDDLTQLRRGTVEFCLLAALQNEDDYGFSLVNKLSRFPGLEITEGSIYPMLTRLRRAGSISTRWEPSADGPPRRYYSLTPAGRRSLDRFRNAWQVYSRSVEAALTKVEQ